MRIVYVEYTLRVCTLVLFIFLVVSCCIALGISEIRVFHVLLLIPFDEFIQTLGESGNHRRPTSWKGI